MSTGNQQQRTLRQGLPWRRHRGLLVLCVMGVFAFVLLILSVFGDQGLFRIRLLARDRGTVSYTHLTLPTIYSV